MFTYIVVLVELNLVLHSSKTTLPSFAGPSRPVLPSHACHERNPSESNGIWHVTNTQRSQNAFWAPTTFDFHIPIALLYIQIYKKSSGLHFTRCLHLAPRVAARAKSARMVSGWKPFTFGASNRFNDTAHNILTSYIIGLRIWSYMYSAS